MEPKINIHNKWNIVKTNIKNGEVQEISGENIILNQFWTRFLSANNATCLNYIHVGSGTTPPVATNTQLGAKWAHYASSNEVIDTSHFITDGYITRKLSCRILANTYVGQTIAEVGFAYGTTATNLMTHSVLKDMNGNPVTVVIGADEIVDVYGTVYSRINRLHNENNVNFFGIASGLLIDAIFCKLAWNSTAVLNSNNSNQTGFMRGKNLLPVMPYQKYTPEVRTGTFTVAYDTVNKKITFTHPDIITTSYNVVGGLASMCFDGVQIQLPCTGFSQPVIIKEVVGTGDGSTKDFQTDFSYILDNATAIAYVNDVVVPATFDYGKPHKDIPLLYLVEYETSSNAILGTNFDDAYVEQQAIFRNPYYATVGITVFTGRYFNVYASDDGTNWEFVTSRSSTTVGATSIGASYQNKQYWKIVPYNAPSSNDWYVSELTTVGTIGLNVHLESAPVAGSTVSVTYQPNVIAKDINHMIKSMKFAFAFNEYIPT